MSSMLESSWFWRGFPTITSGPTTPSLSDISLRRLRPHPEFGLRGTPCSDLVSLPLLEAGYMFLPTLPDGPVTAPFIVLAFVGPANHVPLTIDEQTTHFLSWLNSHTLTSITLHRCLDKTSRWFFPRDLVQGTPTKCSTCLDLFFDRLTFHGLCPRFAALTLGRFAASSGVLLIFFFQHGKERGCA